MKVAFDSSVLIAACLENHPKHKPCFKWLQKARKGEVEGLVSAHSLLETYSVLTRAPFDPKISAAEAKNLIFQNIVAVTHLVGLAPSEYPDLIELLATAGFEGGIVYDGLLALGAENGGAKKIVTSNPGHFLRLATALKFKLEIVGV